MSGKTMGKKKIAKNERRCRICSSEKGMIHRFGINVCRRCFKDVAEKLGFKKMG